MLHRVLAALVLVAGLIALAAVEVGCRPSNSTAQNIPPMALPGQSGYVTFENNKAKILVKLLTKAVDRETAPELEKFDETGGEATGLLHSIPEGTHKLLRQRQIPVPTQMALIRADGEIVEFVNVAAAPMNTELAGYSFVSANAGSTYAGADVRFCLQAPRDWFTRNAIGIGAKAVIPKEFFEPTPQQVMPMIEFVYCPEGVDRTEQNDRKARFALNVAFTAKDRDRALSRDGLAKLSDSEALLVAWNTERRLRINTANLNQTIYIVPWSKETSPSVISDKLIELRPMQPSANEVNQGNEWERYPELRNWEWFSADKYNGFLLFPGAAIQKLKLPKERTMFGGIDFNGYTEGSSRATRFSVSLPEAVQRMALEDDPNALPVRLVPDGQTPYIVNLKPLATNDERYNGLATAAPLSEFTGKSAGNSGAQGSQVVPFDPNVKPAEVAVDGYVVCFDRARRRPLFTAGLKAPFDVALVNEQGRLARVISVEKAEDLPKWPTFTTEAYRYALLMPLHWFALNKGFLLNGSPQPMKPIEFPATWSMLQPEPERYEITVNGKSAWVEIALTRDEIYRGLMWRRSLDADCGMVFLYREAKPHAFWMGQCFVDLNACYIRQNWTIANIVDMLHPVLPDEDPKKPENKGRPKSREEAGDIAGKLHASSEPTHFVLEMELGWFKRWGIGSNTQVQPGLIVHEFSKLATEPSR